VRDASRGTCWHSERSRLKRKVHVCLRDTVGVSRTHSNVLAMFLIVVQGAARSMGVNTYFVRAPSPCRSHHRVVARVINGSRVSTAAFDRNAKRSATRADTGAALLSRLASV
jgi:hypothetical protein